MPSSAGRITPHTDQDLFRPFRRSHLAAFPALAQVDRTPLARQAANLWHVKQLIQQRRDHRLVGDEPLWLVDSLPIDACPFARASFCQRFAGSPFSAGGNKRAARGEAQAIARSWPSP